MSNQPVSLRSPVVKLGAYGLVLGLAFGFGAFIGSTLGPEPAPPATPDPVIDESESHDSHGDPAVDE